MSSRLRRAVQKGGSAMTRGRGSPLRSAVWTSILLAMITAAFAVAPLNRLRFGSGPLLGITYALGVLGAAALVVSQTLSYRSGGGSGAARLRRLLIAVYIAVLFFATAFYLLEHAQPGQFSELHTRLDAVYFTLTVLSTVGFGDVHAAGQAARAMVCAQIVFNLLVVGFAVAAARDLGSSQRRETGDGS